MSVAGRRDRLVQRADKGESRRASHPQRSAVGAACVLDTSSGIDLEMVIIDPRFQRMGIGSDFVANLLRRAHNDRRRIRLRVLKVNPAKALYERLGFVAVGEEAGI